jgi:hypothetical protein
MKMRKFRVRFEGEVEIEVADELLKSCNTDEWRASMFPFKRDEQFVEHIAYNMVLNDLKLGSIDGYADQPERFVAVMRGPLAADWDTEAEEIG